MKTNPIKTHFVLFHKEACPYCQATRKEIKSLQLDIVFKDIYINAEFRKELIEGGGKQQVPCLFIPGKGDEDLWLYESLDIIKYLRAYQKEQLNEA